MEKEFKQTRKNVAGMRKKKETVSIPMPEFDVGSKTPIPVSGTGESKIEKKIKVKSGLKDLKKNARIKNEEIPVTKHKTTVMGGKKNEVSGTVVGFSLPVWFGGLFRHFKKSVKRDNLVDDKLPIPVPEVKQTRKNAVEMKKKKEKEAVPIPLPEFSVESKIPLPAPESKKKKQKKLKAKPKKIIVQSSELKSSLQEARENKREIEHRLEELRSKPELKNLFTNLLGDVKKPKKGGSEEDKFMKIKRLREDLEKVNEELALIPN